LIKKDKIKKKCRVLFGKNVKIFLNDSSINK
jgi:hypothetical protein